MECVWGGGYVDWTGVIVPTDIEDVAEDGGEFDKVLYLRRSDAAFLEETTSVSGNRGKRK